MDYSASNTALWNVIVQLGMIAGVILLGNFLRQKISFIRRSMMPVAVLGGFLLLIAKYTGILRLDGALMEMLVYHGIALGFIAMSLRVPPKREEGTRDHSGLRSGAVIISTYMVQGVIGLLITLVLSYTVLPGLFKASGLLLPMGFGQGPGQANNVGSSYEALGFAGGRSFGLAVAAAGYLVACLVGVVILSILSRREKLRTVSEGEVSQPSLDFFQSKDEIPISSSIDKLSVQLAMVLIVYLATFLAAWGLTSGIAALSPGLANTLNPLIWGFNFIIGSALALLLRVLLEQGKKAGLIQRQYQNNFLLNRISGFFFDIMIVAGIASIDLADIRGLWLPFALMVLAGAALTWIHLRIVCRRAYPDYYYEGLISMYGMLTGTISTGVILLREVDPKFQTQASNNLVYQQPWAIVFGFPMLLLMSFAPQSLGKSYITLGILAALFVVMHCIALRRSIFPKRKAAGK